jgi:UDP-GlcNAc:undecaprenyl-phosphate GlcNAc-1-phosphate transferase
VELFLAFVVALSVTAALIPLLVRVAPSIGLTDAPGPRKVHSVAIPRVGGPAMAGGLIAAIYLTVKPDTAVTGLLLGLGVLLVFGLWDDRVTLGYRTKFAGQVIAVALCMAVGQVRVGDFMIGTVGVLPQWAATVVTFIFLLGVTNAVNLADGLDGLAGGVVLLCLCAIAIFSAISGQASVTSIALIESGAVLGFLRFNTHPARIFMGDSGSQMLGFSVGALGLMATRGDASPLSAALPLLLLGLPIMDTLSVMSTRIRAGRSPFSADRNHLHHRLLTLGFAHHEAVLLIYLMQVVLVLLAYFLRFHSDMEVLITFCLFAGLVLGLVHRAVQAGWKLGHRPLKRSTSSVPSRASAPSARIPGLTLGVMMIFLVAYASTVLASSRHVEFQLGLLSFGMLLVLLLLSWWKAQGPLQWFERASIYITMVILVYLDQTMPHKPLLLSTLAWICIGTAAAAALVRFWLSPTRRFELTTLDLIVVFIALVLPNLPQSIDLPANLPEGVAKAVLLSYVAEMLLSVDLAWLAPRGFLMLTFAIVTCRALFGLSV